MPRPPKWRSPTESVRLPAHLIPRLLEIAQTLDQPLPKTELDQEFQDYVSFVQNSVKPKLCTIRDTQDGFKEHNYVIQADPLTFEEWQQLKQVNQHIEETIFKGLSNDERLYLISLLVQEVFPEHESTKVDGVKPHTIENE